MALVERCDAYLVPATRILDADADLQSLAACNTSEEYERALRTAFPEG
jgi:hypothetical protein